MVRASVHTATQHAPAHTDGRGNTEPEPAAVPRLVALLVVVMYKPDQMPTLRDAATRTHLLTAWTLQRLMYPGEPRPTSPTAA